MGRIVAGWRAWQISIGTAKKTRATPITASYRNTQNVRRFFKAECGSHFKFDRPFMAWLKNGKPKTMADAADEWTRRNKKNPS